MPEAVEGEPGLFVVDATWGTIAPIQVAPGVRTVGEVEVLEHLEQGLPVVDTRSPSSHERSTIPGARNIPHMEVVARIDELDRGLETVFFCNGPQCPATPNVVEALLAVGYPANAILYYRGGIRDWLTLGLPSSGAATTGHPAHLKET